MTEGREEREAEEEKIVRRGERGVTSRTVCPGSERSQRKNQAKHEVTVRNQVRGRRRGKERCKERRKGGDKGRAGQYARLAPPRRR